MAHGVGNPPDAASVRTGFFGKLDYGVFQVEKGFTFLSSLCIFALMIIGVVQIFGRKFFGMPIYGYIDMVELSMTTFAFLAISYTERLGGDVRMDLLIGKLRGRAQWLAEFTSVIVAMVVIAVLIYYGWEHAMRAYNYGDSTIDAQYPMWPSKMMVPISFALLFLRLALMAYGYGRLLFRPDQPVIGVPVVANVQEMAQAEAAEAFATGPDAKEGR